MKHSEEAFSLTYFESDPVMPDREVRQDRSFLKYVWEKQFTEVDAIQERQINNGSPQLEQILDTQQSVP